MLLIACVLWVWAVVLVSSGEQSLHSHKLIPVWPPQYCPAGYPLAGHEMALTLSPPRTLALIFSRLPSGKPSYLILHKESRGKCSQRPLTQIYHPRYIYLLSVSVFTPVTKERVYLCSCEAVFLFYSRNLFRLVFLILTQRAHCLSAHKLQTLSFRHKRIRYFAP